MPVSWLIPNGSFWHSSHPSVVAGLPKEENKAAPPFLPESSRAPTAAQRVHLLYFHLFRVGSHLVPADLEAGGGRGGVCHCIIGLDSRVPGRGAPRPAPSCQPLFPVQGMRNSSQQVCQILFAPLVQSSLKTATWQIQHYVASKSYICL